MSTKIIIQRLHLEERELMPTLKEIADTHYDVASSTVFILYANTEAFIEVLNTHAIFYDIISEQ